MYNGAFLKSFSRVKSGKFGHQVNSDTHLETVSHQDFHCLLN